MRWVAGLLLPLTRAIGVFAVVPIAWYAARESGLLERVGEWDRRKWEKRRAHGRTDLANGDKGTVEAGEGAVGSGPAVGLRYVAAERPRRNSALPDVGCSPTW